MYPAAHAACCEHEMLPVVNPEQAMLETSNPIGAAVGTVHEFAVHPVRVSGCAVVVQAGNGLPEKPVAHAAGVSHTMVSPVMCEQDITQSSGTCTTYPVVAMGTALHTFGVHVAAALLLGAPA